jgi:hypothetical protein
VFDVRRSRADDELAGGGQRWTVRAELAGGEFERVAIDVGFDLPPVVSPDSISASHLLEFAGIDPVIVPALAVEQHLGPPPISWSQVDVVVVAVHNRRLCTVFSRALVRARPSGSPAAWSASNSAGERIPSVECSLVGL